MDRLREHGRGRGHRHDRPAPRVRYRDGLLIAMLAARPLRTRSLVSLTLGDSIVRGDRIWRLRVRAAA